MSTTCDSACIRTQGCCGSREPGPAGEDDRGGVTFLPSSSSSSLATASLSFHKSLTNEDRSLLSAILRPPAVLPGGEDVLALRVFVRLEGRERVHSAVLSVDARARLLIVKLDPSAGSGRPGETVQAEEVADQGAYAWPSDGRMQVRVPFKDVANVVRDDDFARRIHIELAQSSPHLDGPLSVIVRKDAEQDVLEAMTAVNNVITAFQDADWPMLYVGVQNAASEPRLLQIDLVSRVVTQLFKGEPEVEFHFSDVAKCALSDEDETTLTVHRQTPARGKGSPPPEPVVLECQTAEDRALLHHFFHAMAGGKGADVAVGARLSHAELAVLPFWPAKYQKADMLEKEGTDKWSRRWVCLSGTRVFIFRTDRARKPLTTIGLLGAAVAREGPTGMLIESAYTTFVLRAPNKALRDAWIEAMERAQNASRKPFDQFLRTRK